MLVLASTPIEAWAIKMSYSNRSNFPRWLIFVAIFCVVSGLIAVITYGLSFGPDLSDDAQEWALFGDYLGGVLNPIFALAALFALLYTIYLQSTELRNSTEQLRKSAEALDSQNNVLRKQSFESTFFQLLRLYNEIVDELRVTVRDPFMRRQGQESEYENRNALLYLNNNLKDKYIEKVRRGDFPDIPEVDAISQEYDNFYSQNAQHLGHYFRTMYNILKFIEFSAVKEQDKFIYANLLRAQLSKQELALLLYNCISLYGRRKMLPLVKKYRLLKHIEDDSVADVEHIGLIDTI
ncbi:putative phage abortive infection protein [Marinobacter pelagius]|nr:putative phage abortive infection protein [Marinobacter pelagius]